MSNKKMGQVWLATKPGAYAQAMDLAAKSDSLARRGEKAGTRKRGPQDHIAMVRRQLPWALWALAGTICAIALDLHSR